MGRRSSDYVNSMKWMLESAEEEGLGKLPTHKIVCPSCNGEGKHINPAIDEHGITADEWWNEWDDDSREMYLTGGYDVTCYECNGKNVIDEINMEQLTPEQKKFVDDWWDGYYESKAMEAAERRMGA